MAAVPPPNQVQSTAAGRAQPGPLRRACPRPPAVPGPVRCRSGGGGPERGRRSGGGGGGPEREERRAAGGARWGDWRTGRTGIFSAFSRPEGGKARQVAVPSLGEWKTGGGYSPSSRPDGGGAMQVASPGCARFVEGSTGFPPRHAVVIHLSSQAGWKRCFLSIYLSCPSCSMVSLLFTPGHPLCLQQISPI